MKIAYLVLTCYEDENYWKFIPEDKFMGNSWYYKVKCIVYTEVDDD